MLNGKSRNLVDRSKNHSSNQERLSVFIAQLRDLFFFISGLQPRSNMADFLKKLPMLCDGSYKPNEYRKTPDISGDENIVELVMP